MSRTKFYLILLSVQIIVAIIVYVSLSDVPTEEIQTENKDGVAKQVYWTYEEENGPKEWVSIDPSYYACGGGYEQSPINIDKNSVWEEQNFEKLEFNYKPTKFFVENNGYTIEVKDPSEKNTVTIDGVEFTLVQIHFHLPSEHQLNGQTYNMEGHLVHESNDGKLAVIGFFIKEGKVNTDLVDLWALLPEHVTSKPIEVKRSIDLNEVLPEDRSVFQYSGSLTTPPCTEGVTWILFEKPVEMSAIQIEAFAEIYSHNNRPVQQIYNRKIYNFNLDSEM